MAEEIKTRAWFQIHLSTAVVLMFVAGGLIGLNCIETHPPFDDWDGLDQLIGDGVVMGKSAWGFPCSIYIIRSWKDPVAVQKGPVTVGIVFDSLFAMVILLLVTFGCEWRIRRRFILI